MKRVVSSILLCLIISAICVGCGNNMEEQEQASQMTTIGNPWLDWASIEEAEAAVGFHFGIPAVIADGYEAVSIRTMNHELIQVTYRYENSEICIRKQKGEGQDISGDYNQYEICTESSRDGGTIISYRNVKDSGVKQLVSYKGYSWSLVASDDGWGQSGWNFESAIWEQ